MLILDRLQWGSRKAGVLSCRVRICSYRASRWAHSGVARYLKGANGVVLVSASILRSNPLVDFDQLRSVTESVKVRTQTQCSHRHHSSLPLLVGEITLATDSCKHI